MFQDIDKEATSRFDIEAEEDIGVALSKFGRSTTFPEESTDGLKWSKIVGGGDNSKGRLAGVWPGLKPLALN